MYVSIISLIRSCRISIIIERNIPIFLKTGLADVTALIILEFAKIPDDSSQETVEFQEVDPSMNTILQVFGDMAKGIKRMKGSVFF